MLCMERQGRHQKSTSHRRSCLWVVSFSLYVVCFKFGCGFELRAGFWRASAFYLEVILKVVKICLLLRKHSRTTVYSLCKVKLEVEVQKNLRRIFVLFFSFSFLNAIAYEFLSYCLYMVGYETEDFYINHFNIFTAVFIHRVMPRHILSKFPEQTDMRVPS